MQQALLVFASAAAAFAPTPNQRIDTRLHFNFGNFGGKKVDEKEAVKLAETVDVIGALLRAGADTVLRDSSGATPAALAARYGHPEAAAAIKAAGRAQSSWCTIL